MCIHINDSYNVYYLHFHAHRAMPQIKSFMQRSNTYMYITHVINSNREHSEILKRFFDNFKLVNIEINIILKSNLKIVCKTHNFGLFTNG